MRQFGSYQLGKGNGINNINDIEWNGNRISQLIPPDRNQGFDICKSIIILQSKLFEFPPGNSL